MNQDAATETPSDGFRKRLLVAMLASASEKGWTDAAFKSAATRAGLSEGEAILAAPNGVSDLLDALYADAAKAAGGRLADPGIGNLKVRQKVAAGIKAWLASLQPHKDAVRRASGSPANVLAGPKGLWAAADAIWVGLGDASTDANWYTKRMTLSAVLGSTVMAWLGTEDEAEIEAFIDRRIENVMQFEKAKKQARDFAARFPNPLDLLGRKAG
jgi:ubiquinone biosynthesis protein COQ9